MSRSWLVTHMATDDSVGGGWHCDWSAFETLPHAQQFYDECVDAGAYSVSLCAVVQSTDYEPHELFKEDN